MLPLACLPGCRTADTVKGPTLAQIEELRSLEALLPIAPDSIIALYRRYEPQSFYREFGPRVDAVRHLIDSLNAFLPEGMTIDTLAIDHTVENFGTAARTGRTIYLSSSFFFSFADPSVERSTIMHEFGHAHYELLAPEPRARMEQLWTSFQSSALLYLFRDGEYSGNARFGGHPEESPEELFASAFNLFLNRKEEIEARLVFVESRHLPAVRALERLVADSGRSPR